MTSISYYPTFSSTSNNKQQTTTTTTQMPSNALYAPWHWVCDPHKIAKLAAARKAKDPNHPGCVIYSIGRSNGDFSFEMGMQNEIGAGVCEFHIFDIKDYTPSKVPKEYRPSQNQERDLKGSRILSNFSAMKIWIWLTFSKLIVRDASSRRTRTGWVPVFQNSNVIEGRSQRERRRMLNVGCTNKHRNNIISISSVDQIDGAAVSLFGTEHMKKEF